MIDNERLKKLQGFWNSRDTTMKEDRRVLRLEKGRTKEGFEEVVLNEPKVLYETSVGMLSANFPKFKLPIRFDASVEEKTKMQKAERFLQGIFRQLDENHAELGRGQWVRELAYWICSGWSVNFAHIDESGNFHADFFDPLTVFPRWTQVGLREVARITEISKEEAEGLLEFWNLKLNKKLGERVKLINYWEKRLDGIYNTILFNEEPVKAETLEKFKRMPLIIGLANGIPERNTTDWPGKLGQSIIAANKEMFEQQNRWVSMLMQIVSDTAYPPIVTQTPDGSPVLTKDDLGSGIVIPTRVDETIETLKYAGTPIEVNTLLSILTGCVQRGGLPYVIYGGLPFELSGFALSQLMAAIQYKISPYVRAMEQVLSRLAVEFIEQFHEYGKTISLAVREKGKYYVEDFTKADIPKVRFVEARVLTGSPQDKMQEILAARQALQPPALLSRETIWEDHLEVEDPKLEYDRIIADQVNELPITKLLKVADEMRKRALAAHEAGNTEEARVFIGYAQVIINQLTQNMQSGGQESGGQGSGGGAYSGSAGQGVRTGRVTPEQEAAARGQRVGGIPRGE